MGAGWMKNSHAQEEVANIGRFKIPVLQLAILASAFLVSVVLLLVNFNPPDADVKYDWLVTQEALRPGGDAYTDISELADQYELEIEVNADPAITVSRRHPRTPGALLVQIPLVLVSQDLLFALASFVSIICIGWLSTIRPGDGSNPSPRIVLLVALATIPTFQTLRFAGQGALVAVLVLIGWLAIRNDRPKLGGVLIGIASLLKLFPLILLIPLIRHRRDKASIAVVTTFLSANLIGLALPGVSLASSIEALSNASALWQGLYSNGSVLRILDLLGVTGTTALATATAFLLVCGFLLTRDMSTSSSPFAWLALALLVLPLSWASYDLVLLPAIASTLVSEFRSDRVTGLVVLLLWLGPVLLPPLMDQSGSFSFVVRALIVCAAIAGSRFSFPEWSLLPARPSKPVPKTVPY